MRTVLKKQDKYILHVVMPMNTNCWTCLFLVFVGLFWSNFSYSGQPFNTSSDQEICFTLLQQMPIIPFEGSVLHYENPNKLRLGSGIMGGEVDRIFDPKNGKSWVEKKFYNQNFYQNDKRALAIIELALAQMPHPYFQMVEIIAVDDENRRIHMDWVAGEVLATKIEDWNNPIQRDFQRSLLDIYTEFVQYFSAAMDSLIDQQSGRFMIKLRRADKHQAYYTLQYEDESNQRVSVQIGIRRDNIVIQDYPRRLVLIDPF